MQVSLLVLSSSRTVTAEQLQEWLEGILGSDTCLAQHIGQHRVLSTPPLPSAASNALLEESLLWLAKSTPLQPRLQVRHCGTPAIFSQCDASYTFFIAPPEASWPQHVCTTKMCMHGSWFVAHNQCKLGTDNDDSQ